jgi:hypothetical protein
MTNKEMKSAVCALGNRLAAKASGVSRSDAFIGCIWFNTLRLCRGSKFKNICKIGIKADTLKKFPIQRQPFFCYNKKYTKAEKGLIPQGSALR